MAKMLILSPHKSDKKPTKIIDKSGNTIESYKAGYSFVANEYEYDNFHEMMAVQLTDEDSFIVLGELTEYGKSQVYEKKPIRRIKKDKVDDPATIRDSMGKVVALDLDDVVIKGWNPNKPESFIKNWLSSNKIACDVTWQITSSQKLGSDNARIRLYFECSKLTSLQERKAYASTLGTDTSVFTCSQPIYTAPPIIRKGDKDFIKKRHGFIKGDFEQILLPKYTPEEIRQLTTFEYSGYEYESADLPSDVLDGTVHRRYFRGLALHYMNKVQEKDAVFYIIKGKLSQLPDEIRESRGNSDENIHEYIDGAFDRILLERKVDIAEEKEDAEIETVKLMDEEVLAPDNKFGELVRALYELHWIPNLMVANVVARMTVAHGGAGIYRSEIGDRMNIQSLIIGESGCGKDLINFGINTVFDECFDEDEPIYDARSSNIVHKVASMEGIQDLLFQSVPYEDALMVFDEFGGLLDKAKSNPKLQELFEDLMKAYTWSDMLVPKRRKANAKGEDNSIITHLHSPHINMIGATTQALLIPALEYKFVGMGMLSRFMFFDADKYKGLLREEKKTDIRFSEELKANLRYLSDASQLVRGLHKLPSARRYSPKIVYLADGLKKHLHKHGLEDNQRKGHLKEIWNRRTANAKKLAMVEAIVENPYEPIITEEIMNRSLQFATDCCSYADKLFREEVGMGEFDVAMTQVCKRMREKFGLNKWIKRSDAMNVSKVIRMKPNEKRQLINELEENGYIETMKAENNKGILMKLVRTSLR